ncbi:set 5, partial [Fusarium albosuccineum]
MAGINSPLPDEPVLHPIFASLAIDDIPELDLQVFEELTTSDNVPLPLNTGEPETPEEEPEHAAATPIPSSEKPLLCKEVLARDGLLSTSPDSVITDYIGTSGSEPEFTSDSDFWTDDEDDDTTEESVLCLTSRGARPLDSADILRPPLPRRLSFKPLESVTPPLRPSSPTREPLSTPNTDEGPLTPSAAGPSPGIVIFENDYFTVAQSTIAGWGAFATRDLKYGDRILQERPLILANANTLFKEFDKLSMPERELALGLHANSDCKLGTPRLQAVWTTNCFSTGIGSEAGLFPIASRFNHSCHPRNNVGYIYDHVEEALVMAVKAAFVPAGNELTICYGYQRTPRDLFYRFGFRCRCGACRGFAEDKEIDI